MNFSEADIKGLKVTVMGLGLHGGGAATAAFFAARGAEVLVTDLRNEEVLAGSLELLSDFPITYVLGEHREKDFIEADMILKNPAVPPSSPFLTRVEKIETDISIFLRLNKRPVIAVTGSKGKSTTTSAVYHALKSGYGEPALGGNITVSPLSFFRSRSIDDWNSKGQIDRSDPVVLELSSWQLADLAGLIDDEGRGILKPKVAVLTNILKDHQDRYGGMESYIADKMNIFLSQVPGQYTICSYDQKTGHDFARKTRAQPFFFSASPLPESIEGAWLENSKGWIRKEGKVREILPEEVNLPGSHNRLNLLIAAAALSLFGEPEERTAGELAKFSGIAHRLEFVREKDGIRFYNDSAATIPDAVAAALDSFSEPVYLITGGTDKDLDFTPLEGSLSKPEKIFLLDGTARSKFETSMAKEKKQPAGVYSSLKSAFDEAVRAAAEESSRGTRPLILLSPGCASFGMFLNEFDRGNQFRDMVNNL